MSVYIVLDFTEEVEQNKMQRTIRKSLLNAGKNRAVLILASYLRVHATDIRQIQERQEMITGILNTATIRRKKCGEESCAALIDFDITGFPVSSAILESR